MRQKCFFVRAEQLEFQLTHPMWGATLRLNYTLHIVKFQLTHPMWGATSDTAFEIPPTKFQLTHPMWGATDWSDEMVDWFIISTHTPHVGCDGARFVVSVEPNISTHTPHVGCDSTKNFILFHGEISTHTPHVGCDHTISFRMIDILQFQLTHPMWGATQSSTSYVDTVHISTHTPHVGCDKRNTVFR